MQVTNREALKNITRLLPNLLTDEEMGQLSVEANKYVANSDVKSLADAFTPEHRVDTSFWVKVYNLQKFTLSLYQQFSSYFIIISFFFC